MKPEKMTPEDVETFNRVASGADESWDDRWRAWMKKGAAHIAALETERDSKAEDVAEACRRINRIQTERDALRERVKALEQERDNALAAAGVAREETRGVRDALGRVSAQAEQWGDALKTTASTLAGMRQRAGDAKALAEVLRRTEATWTDEAMAEVARYIVGEDGAGAEALCDGKGRKRDDAPPVFTLEEVEGSTAKPNWYRDAPTRSEEYRDGYEAALSDVRSRLAALRR
jgi:hypothetical protein